MLAVIPAFRRPEQLQRCLAALDASEVRIDRFVHDNSEHNVGFTKACNLGLRRAWQQGYPFALLLNQDCYIRPDTVGRLLAFMDSHPRCGIAGVQQLKADDPDVIIHGGCLEAFPAGRHITGRVSAGDCSTSLPMPWVNGACMAVRTEMLFDTGLMDEGYFLIASDSDFCFTARQRGWDVWYCAEATVLHETGGISQHQPDLDAAAHFNADQARFRDKWVGTIGFELLRQMPPAPGLRPAPADLRQALAQAQQHYQRNELGQAELQTRHILTHLPGQPDAMLLLGRTHLRLGLPALALRELKSVVEHVPDSATAHFALADAYMLCQQTDLACTHYARAVELGLASAELHNNFGVALLRAHRREEAAQHWRRALALDPANAAARKNLEDAGLTP